MKINSNMNTNEIWAKMAENDNENNESNNNNEQQEIKQ